MKATLETQEGGDHYRKFPIQPIQYIIANGIGFLAGNVIKYVTRYRSKNGAEDIRKAIHYLQLILEFEYPDAVNSADLPKAEDKCPWCLRSGGHHMPDCLALKEAYDGYRTDQKGSDAPRLGEITKLPDHFGGHPEGGAKGSAW